ncbi:MAG: DUF502 domain-containing protein [Puniceicoccales bacterium]
MRSLSRIFIRGLAALLPVFLTLYVVFWSISFLEKALSGVLQVILPEQLYIPGMGLLVLFAAVMGLGAALSEIHFKRMYFSLESHLGRVPVVKSIYGICKDFMDYFANQKQRKQFSQTVTVSTPNNEFKLVGFITEEDLSRHHEKLADSDSVAVYLPMGYQIGGYTLLIKRRYVEPLDMNFEDAMRFILTAGVASHHNGDTTPPFVAAQQDVADEVDSATKSRFAKKSDSVTQSKRPAA